jgi:putative salt-induced outer membrane protein YdiY
MIRRWGIIFFVLLLAGVVVAEEQEVPPLQRLLLPKRDLLPDPEAFTNRPSWKSSATLGFSMTRGNSDTLLTVAKLQTQWKSRENEWLLGSDGAYGEDNSQKTREALHGYGQFNHFFNPQLYDFGRVDGLHDGIKDIRYRFTASTGLGYYLVQRTNLAFAVEAGPSLVTERQGKDDQLYGAARLASRFEYKLGPNARIWQGAELIPQIDRTDNFILNAEIGIETAIVKDVALQVYVQDNYVNQPAPDYKHNDFRLLSGLSYKF